MTAAQKRAVAAIAEGAVFYDAETGRGVALPSGRKVIDRRTLNALVDRGVIAQETTGRLKLSEEYGKV